MSIILAIETSAELASAALLQGDQLSIRSSSGVKTHSDSILPMVQALLQHAGIRLNQCDALAFGNGPGSFTGVRTAAGVVQGLAFGSQRPVIAVGTLEAMAQACREQSGASDVVAILDARMGEVYWAQYRFADGGWHTVIAPTLSLPAAVMPLGQVTACGNGLLSYAAVLAEHPFVAALSGVMPHAAQVAQLARLALLRGDTLAPQDVQPLYLRNKVALTTIERMAKSAGTAG